MAPVLGALPHLALAVLGAFLACGDDGASVAVPPVAPVPPAAPAAPRAAPAQAALPAGAAMGPYLDLVAQVARAELHRGPALIMDLGSATGAKYTFGGWQTGSGPNRVFGGSDAVVFPGVAGEIILPLDSDGPHTVSVRARTFGDGRLTLAVDQMTTAQVTLPADGSFAVVTAQVPPEHATAGEHWLQLQVASTGAVPGGGTAGVAVDWIVVAPTDDAAAREIPPPPADLARSVDGTPTLVLPDGLTVGYGVEVPRGARLGATVAGAGRLTVRAHRDGAAVQNLGSSDPGGGPLDIDLSAFAGEVIRLDLTARGEVTLSRPAIRAPGGPARGPGAERPRNLVIFLVDTLRADRLRAWSPSTRVATPGLDAWARDAVVVERAQSQENWTRPSVATLLSGLLPWHHGAFADEAALSSSVVLISEHLRQRGFYTGAFIANDYCSGAYGFEQGWSTWRNYPVEGRQPVAPIVAADVLEWLDARPQNRPFFLYVHTMEPHAPYIPPDEFLARYDSGPYDGPVDFHRDPEILAAIRSGSLQPGERDRRRLEALYDGEITYHDVYFASVMEGLERRGLTDDTVVVFTADHGEELFDHGSVGHGHTLWQELVHVPLLVRVPGLVDAPPVREPVGLVDVMPTALEALGIEPPRGIDGRSFLGLLRGEAETAPRVVLSGCKENWRAVVVGSYKLLQFNDVRHALYDLDADPGETRDLAAERPIAVRYMRGLLGLALASELGTRGTVHRAERVAVDAQTEARLRALGYLPPSPHR